MASCEHEFAHLVTPCSGKFFVLITSAQNVLPSVKTSCPLAENAHETPDWSKARNSGLPTAKMQAKIQVWQAKINLNCQTENKMASEI